MEAHVFLDCETCARPDTLVSKDGISGVSASSQDLSTPQLPAKKQPRQWAAWTRQEEESFFTALKQVGKNFEKITSRVQSKNKDQVRHYYYRLVRRMNKLLGPELCLDAKNSKVTNAAMLRWWSLLEKYSCKASKLHLKPRRYKLFVETLENQLLRDRRKTIRKCPAQGENSSASAPSTLSIQCRASVQENRAVKEVLADSQKIQKLGTGKGSPQKRQTNIGINRANCKAESSLVKTARSRRKIGTFSPAAYKKWEKAAIAGVSLVADAAEHLERTTIGKEVECVQDGHVPAGLDRVREDEHPLPNLLLSVFSENNLQGSVKFKLQLFPIDESTRRALEMDNLNPHLELTLSNRKKISSVLEHLNRKWGSSTIAYGELMLFPYSAQKETLWGCQKWTKECNLNAADVYALVGSPPVFRLRYGWFSNAELGSAAAMVQLPLSSASATVIEHNANMNNLRGQKVHYMSASNLPTQNDTVKSKESIKDQLAPGTEMTTATDGLADSPREFTIMDSSENIFRYPDNTASLSLRKRDGGLDTIVKQVENRDDLRTHNGITSSAGEWADSFTNISIGDLLSEASFMGDANCINTPIACSSHSLQQIPFNSESFDAAIAAHIYKHQNKAADQPVSCHGSSIWDAEETCDAFAFQKNGSLHETVQGSSSCTSLKICKQISKPSSAAADAAVQEVQDAKESVHDDPAQEMLVDDCHSDSSAKDLAGLTDIYWPDSLGPLDLDIPSSGYRSDDLILSDSLGGLNRLIASSLDAFQNCSFFGLDKKEPASSDDPPETVSFADFKIGTEV